MPSSCLSRCLLKTIPFVGKIQVQCNVFRFISFDIVCLKSAILCLYGFKLYALDPQRISTMLLPAGDFSEIARSGGKFAWKSLGDYHENSYQNQNFKRKPL